MTTPATIGIDLGGTNIKTALIEANGSPLSRRVSQYDPTIGPDATVELIAAAVDEMRSERGDSVHLVGAGIGCPGPMDRAAGRVINAANLPGWHDVPIRDLLSRRLELPVAFDNDGNAAAFGEYWAGAGRGVQDVVMLTLGTGVGAGVILAGQLLHGHFDNAAELGHTIVVADGIACACGQRGCLEQYSSASGVARRVASAIRSGSASTLAHLVERADANDAAAGVDATTVADGLAAAAIVDAAAVAEAVRAGDELCMRIWDEACMYLAIACVNIQHTLNPARVILGGGMAQSGALLLDPVRAHLAKQTWKLHNDQPEIVLAELGYDAGMIGAAGLAWRASGSAGG